jgi:hypothetical protein
MYYYNQDNPFNFRRNPKEALLSILLCIGGVYSILAMLLFL